MGTWGTDLFDDDTACDIRDEYREQIEDGVADAEAMRSTLASFDSYFDDPADPETAAISILALAITQSKIGRLDTGIRSRALAAIDNGADLARWERDDPKSLPKRRAALEKVRAQLTGPQPARKRLRPPRRELCGLVAGDGLTLPIASGLALLRVVRVKSDRLGETPILEELQFEGAELPSPDELDRLEAKPKGAVALGSNPRFGAWQRDKIGWEQAGFRKVASFAPRAGDEEAYGNSHVAWYAVAKLLRGEIR